MDCEGVICRTTRGFALLDSCTPSVELLPLALPHEKRIHPDAQIAVALGRTVYLWNAGSGAVEELCSCANEADYICSVAWSGDGSYLALGTSDAKVCPLNTLARHLAVALLCSIHVTRAKCGFGWHGRSKSGTPAERNRSVSLTVTQTESAVWPGTTAC